MSQPFYTLEEAARMLGMKRDRLSRAINGTASKTPKDGKDLPVLRAKKIGRRYLILESDLKEWALGLPDA